jgi:replicative DNA helicase|uniref:SF4 helicase domain-containing protein n=1 Tax=Dictyoglomus turgidum TaxID=513050 RepID=A0A7C3SQK2_9BACT
MIKFKDPQVEKLVLAAFLKGPEFWKEIPESWFEEELHRRCYKEFKKILRPPYSTFPTPDIIIDKTNDPDVKILVLELKEINITLQELNVRIQDLFDMFCSRKLFDVASKLPEELQSKNPREIVREKISVLSELVNPFGIKESNREFIYDSAVERWEYYKGVESKTIESTAIPFHINDLDYYTNGGLRKTHMMLIVAGTGEFKTLTKLSIAYNYAFIEKKDTMVLTLEVPGSGDQRDYQRMIDARHSLLEFKDIVSGKLNVNRGIYREKLIDIVENKYPLYIVDIPDKATSGDVIKEIELYFAKTGKYPDAVIIDYLNEMEPLGSYSSSSEKFKLLASELRVIARTYGTRLITSMQLNREGKKIKEGEKRDLENISESHYVTNPFHVIVFLHQDPNGIDAATNQLHWTIRKNRYGQKNVTFTTFANPAFCYVGDRKIIYPGYEQ